MVETFYDLPFSEKLKEISFAPPISSGVFPGRRLFLSSRSARSRGTNRMAKISRNEACDIDHIPVVRSLSSSVSSVADSGPLSQQPAGLLS
jgi:hypothetical protein